MLIELPFGFVYSVSRNNYLRHDLIKVAHKKITQRKRGYSERIAWGLEGRASVLLRQLTNHNDWCYTKDVGEIILLKSLLKYGQKMWMNNGFI